MAEELNPYKGIDTYDIKDRAIFHGRDKEIADISNVILNNRSTILSGYSGCGKTSLLKAGILPELEKYNYHLIIVNPRDAYTDVDREMLFPLDFWNKVFDKIHEKCKDYNLVFDNNTNLFDELSYDHTDKWYGNNHSFVIVIDQFEEFFQPNLNDKYKNLFFKIYDILCGNYNEQLIQEVNATIQANIYEYEMKMKRKRDKPEDWNDKLDNHIFPQIFVLPQQINNNRLVITIRKDYLYDLQIYSNRFHVLNSNIKFIEFLDDDQAREVITSCDKFKNWADEDKGEDSRVKLILDTIINKTDYNPADNEPDYYVDTMMLSVIMYEFYEWEKRPTSDDLDTMPEKDFKSTIDRVINNFYYDRINKLKRELVDLVGKTETMDNKKTPKKQIIRCCDDILRKLEDNLISETGSYKLHVYTSEIRDIIDEKVYGEVDFRKIRTQEECVKIKKKLDEYDVFNTEDIDKFFSELSHLTNDSITPKDAKDYRGRFDKILYACGNQINNGKNDKKEESDIIKDIIDKIKMCNLFVSSIKGNQDGIELRHDRLCKYAKEHIDTIDSQRKNALRYSANIYLTPVGRLKHDNCFIEPVFGPWNTYSAIQRTVFFMEGGIAKMLNLDTDFVDNYLKYNNKDADSMLLTYDIRGGNDSESGDTLLDSPELFSKIKVKVVHKKIYEISFWKEDVKNPDADTEVVLPVGYHKIVFYYDKFHRVIIKRFLDNCDKPAKLDGRYNSICYWYEKEYHNLPDITFYTNFADNLLNDGTEEKYLFQEIVKTNLDFEKLQKYLSEHVDGNYGFVSYYDKYGREIVRHLLCKSKVPTKYGFDTIKFERKDESEKDIHNNLIKSISYYSGGYFASYKYKNMLQMQNEMNVDLKVKRQGSKTVGFDFSKCEPVCYRKDNELLTLVHKVLFEYDSSDRITDTYYYNIGDTPCELNGIYGENYNFNGDQKHRDCIISTYVSNEYEVGQDGKKRRKPTVDNDNVMYAIMHRNLLDKKRIDWIEWHDINDNPINARILKVDYKESKEIRYYKIDFSIIANKCFTRYFNSKDENLHTRTSNNKIVRNICFLPESLECISYELEEDNIICINIIDIDEKDDSIDNVGNVKDKIKIKEGQNEIKFYGLILLSPSAFCISDSKKVIDNVSGECIIALKTKDFSLKTKEEFKMYYNNVILNYNWMVDDESIKCTESDFNDVYQRFENNVIEIESVKDEKFIINKVKEVINKNS